MWVNEPQHIQHFRKRKTILNKRLNSSAGKIATSAVVVISATTNAVATVQTVKETILHFITC